MKKFLVISTFILVLLGGGIFAVTDSFDLDSIDVSKETIVSALDKKLPIEKEIILGNKIKIVSADLVLEEGKVGVLLNIEAITKYKIGRGCDEDKPASQLLKRFNLQSLDKCFRSEETTSEILVLAEGNIVYSGSKFYFQPENRNSIEIQTKIEDPFLKKHEDKVGMIIGEIAYAYLNNFPVYDLKKKGIIISAALESVEVHQDYITVNLSLLALTKTLMIYLVAFVLAIGYAFAAFRNPGLLFFFAW